MASNEKTRAEAGGGEKAECPTELKRTVNFLHCTAILIALTGHVSIFITPTDIMRYTGSFGASLFLWLVAGVMNLMLAMCFAEMGTILPTAGGPYAYVLYVFGELPGFLTMWGYILLISGPFLAVMGYTVVIYLITPFYLHCDDLSDGALKLLTAWVLVTVVAVNCLYMKYITKVQTILSGTKMAAILIIIIGGIVKLSQGQTKHFENMFEDTTSDPGDFAMAIFAGVFAFGGWQILLSLLEEVKNPGRNVPWSLYTSFAILIASYIMTIVAYCTLLSPEEMLSSSAVAVSFSSRLHPSLSPIISILVATATIGVLNASIMGHSRVVFAAARVGHLPAVFSMINQKYLTPWPAIGLLLVNSLVMLFSGTLTAMVEFISLYSILLSLVIICSLLYLRWTKPDLHRPLKLHLFIPISQLILTSFVLVLAIYKKPTQMGAALLILFLGVPVYWLGVRWRSKPKWFLRTLHKLTCVTQIIMNVQSPHRLQ